LGFFKAGKHVCFVSPSRKHLERKVLPLGQDTNYELLGTQILFESHNNKNSFKPFGNQNGHRSSPEEALFILTLLGHFKVHMTIYCPILTAHGFRLLVQGSK
jgi:hypothetical protein